jgi:hypothetical protein
MKNFSLPRMAVVVWFFFYSFSCLGSYMVFNARHEIANSIVTSTLMTVVFLVAWGLIEDKF